MRLEKGKAQVSTAVRTQKLTAIRQEMDTALEQEIEEANRRGGRKKHHAASGQLLRTENGRYIYAFTLEDVWEVADDTPVQIESSGKGVNANIVSVAGQSIKIAADWEIPARDLARITLKDDPTAILTALRKSLAEAQDGPNELAAKTFGLQDIRQTQPVASQQIPGFPERGKQRVALSATQTNEVTYVVGPPGTGKTTTLAAIAYQFMVGGMSVLIAANTNIAVDNAIERLADLCAVAPARPELQAGRIIRYGTPQLERVAKRDDVTMKGVVARLSGETRRRLLSLQDQRRERQGALEQAQTQFEQAAKESSEARQRADRDVRLERAQLQILQTRELNRTSVLDGKRRVADSVYRTAYQRVQESEAQLARLTRQRDDLHNQLAGIGSQATTLRANVEAARKANAIARFFKGQNLDQMYAQLSRLEQQEWQTQQNMAATETQINHLRSAHPQFQQAAMNAHEQFTIADAACRATSPDAEAIQASQAKIVRFEGVIRANTVTLNQLDRQHKPHISTFERAIADIDRQIAEEEKRLRDLENECVRNALVVATTLSKTAMAPAIRDRRFDVVIIDEASMAALPAVYVAAAHADQRVVIVGDPKQLAPIAQSERLEATRWLKRDIFALTAVTLEDAATNQKNSVLLDTQYRMRPEISRIPNRRIYHNLLKDGPSVAASLTPIEPLTEKSLLLCDTSAAHPVCTHERGGNSRFNMYHALCAFTLARQALNSLPTRPRNAEAARVGIITPFARQARLLQTMIKEANLGDDIRASTVHRFQGLECEVVIFDTVESDGAAPSRMSKGEDAMRMVNVAITRAQKKLIVVANLNFLSSHFTDDDTILQVAQDARDSSVLSSSDVVFIGATESAHSSPNQAHWHELFASAMSSAHTEVLTEANYYQRLYQDFAAAQNRVIIVSPWMTERRANELIPQLQPCIGRGVPVKAFTRPSSFDPDDHVSEAAIARLRGIGVDCETWSEKMHEKVVFVNEDVVYIGSLNTLSFADGYSNEIILRIVSRSMAEQIYQTLGIGKRTYAHTDTPNIRPENVGAPLILKSDWFPTGHRCANGHPCIVKTPGKDRSKPFYACTQYSTGCRAKCVDSVGQQDVEISFSHLPSPVLCQRCGSAMRPLMESSHVWAVCTNTTPCSFRRKASINWYGQ